MAKASTKAGVDLLEDTGLLQDLWRSEGFKIALAVEARARRARNGDLYWTQPALPGAQAGTRPLDSYLYPGSLGLALFFALAHNVLGVGDFDKTARLAVDPLLRQLRSIARDPARVQSVRRPLGGFAGLGSLIYGLVRLGDVLDDPRFWDDASTVTRFIPPERIREDRSLEIMTGSAGVIPSLLTLDERLPTPNSDGYRPLDLAKIAGDHLIEQKPQWLGTAPVGDPEQTRQPTIGFCHGAAGIAAAIARLDRRLESDSFASTIDEVWAEIDQTFDHRRGLWQLPMKGAVTSISWCNGATGLLFSRALCFDQETYQVDEIFQRALEAWVAADLVNSDHLCCGNLGRVDTLIHLSGLLGTEYLEAASRLAQQVLDRAHEEGKYRLMLHPHGVDDVRLFPGLSGIGYSFLRLAEPQVLPSLLALV